MKNASNKHIIRRQVLDVKFPRSAPAFEWQHELSRYHQHHLLALLEKACNEVCADDEVIQLDQVTIDLGVIPLKDLKNGKCDEDIYALLLAQLQQQIPAIVRVSAKAAGSIRLSVARQWLYYMQWGYLPWNTIKADRVWYEQVLEAFATDIQAVVLFRERLQREQVVVQRVVRDHRQEFLVQLLEILTATRQVEILKVLEELEVLSSATSNSAGAVVIFSFVEKQAFWQFVLKAAAADKKGRIITPVELARVYIQQHRTIIVPEYEKVIHQLTILGPLIREEKESMRVSSPMEEIIITPAQTSHLTNLINSETGIPQDGIFLINAGVVLLHPFLGTLFKKLQLQLKDPADHEKALYIIHYLATGETETPEHALIVPKLLCDWPLGKNLAHETLLTPEECAAADEMLEAVIEHWDKLQHAGIAALRGSFLQRNGKVFTHNEQTFIQVEQHSLDVLLDYLPWSISHIKLPWMKSILRIEWR